MSSIARAATFGMFAVCWLPAQTPASAASLRLVVGDRILEMPAGREVAVLSGQRNVPPAVWLGGDRYVRGEVCVDASTGESLEQERSTLALRDATHRRSWAVEDVAFAGALPQSRLLLPDRVVVAASGGGIVALGRRRLAVTESGDLLVVGYDDISDSGFAITCRDSRSGEVLWRHEEGGLRVDHSKYRHFAEARAIGGSVFVTSQGSAGAFVVELDAADGRRRARHEVGR